MKPTKTTKSPDNFFRVKKTVLVKEDASSYPLTRINFYIMAAAAFLIILGFLLMLGSGSTTEQFNPDIFSTRRIIVGPTIAFIGFVVMAVGIIKRPGKKVTSPENSEK